jgi:ABC-type transport system substrate-binding protein
MDDTGQVWTVTLRDNLQWSDGEPITADDIVYTTDLIRDPTAKTTISADFNNVAIKKLDDKTVEFRLPSTYVDFMDTLEFPLVPAHILSGISPALVYENEYSMNPVVSGPFKFNAMQLASVTSTHTSTIYLNRNDKYHLSSAKLETFTIKTYKSLDDIIEAMNEREKPVVFILWGRAARNKAPMIHERHLVIESAHPSPLSANRGFFGSRPFSRTNAFLREHGIAEIDWRID